jgi:hypothetical protein
MSKKLEDKTRWHQIFFWIGEIFVLQVYGQDKVKYIALSNIQIKSVLYGKVNNDKYQLEK